MINKGTIAKKTAQLIKKELEKTIEPLPMLGILRKYIRFVDDETDNKSKQFQKREVILSGYVVKK
jgi:hypothetical protein